MEEENVNPGDVSKLKEPIQINAAQHANEKDFDEDKSGYDLHVAGSELDDKQEAVASEDEEIEYYSLRGDDHNDLEEGRD